MKLSEIRAMNSGSLKESVAELKAELAREKAVVAGGTRPENPGKIKSIRKNIARILTVMNEKKTPEKAKKER